MTDDPRGEDAGYGGAAPRGVREAALRTRLVWLWTTALPRIGRYDRIERLSSFDYLMEEHFKMHPPFLAALSCGDVASYWSKPFAFLHTNLNVFRLLEQNPMYAGRLAALFPDGAVFPALARLVTRPTAPVAHAVEVFDAAHLAPTRRAGRLLVGVHLRVGMGSNRADRAMKQFGRTDAAAEAARVCVANAVLVREEGAARPPSSRASTSARSGAFQRWSGDEREVWSRDRGATIFVASDHEDLRSRAQTRLEAEDGVHSVVAFNGIVDEESAVGLQAAMVELLILSRCDVIVRAGKMNSLFSGTAAALMASPFHPIYWASIDAPSFVQCDTLRGARPCGVTASGTQARFAIVEAVLEPLGDAPLCPGLGEVYPHGPRSLGQRMRARRTLFPTCATMDANDAVQWHREALA